MGFWGFGDSGFWGFGDSGFWGLLRFGFWGFGVLVIRVLVIRFWGFGERLPKFAFEILLTIFLKLYFKFFFKGFPNFGTFFSIFMVSKIIFQSMRQI